MLHCELGNIFPSINYDCCQVSLITTGPDWLYLLSEGQGEGPLVYTAGSEIQIFASNGISIPVTAVVLTNTNNIGDFLTSQPELR